MVRALIAGLLGGVLVFVAGWLGHTQLELTEGAMAPRIPHEDAVMAAIRSNVPQPGFYSVPWMDHSKTMTPEEKTKAEEAWMQKYKVGPNAIILRGPDGEEFDKTRHILLEGASDVVAALLLAFAITFVGAGGGFLGRWLACILLGAFAVASLTVSYGIWYYMPMDYVKGELFESLLEWGIGGLAIAAIVKPRAPSP